MITGMNKEKTSKGMILGAYGRMIDIALEIKYMSELKEALVIAATQDDAWRRSAIDVESQREERRCVGTIIIRYQYPGFRKLIFCLKTSPFHSFIPHMIVILSPYHVCKVYQTSRPESLHTCSTFLEVWWAYSAMRLTVPAPRFQQKTSGYPWDCVSVMYILP